MLLNEWTVSKRLGCFVVVTRWRNRCLELWPWEPQAGELFMPQHRPACSPPADVPDYPGLSASFSPRPDVDAQQDWQCLLKCGNSAVFKTSPSFQWSSKPFWHMILVDLLILVCWSWVLNVNYRALVESQDLKKHWSGHQALQMVIEGDFL